MSKNFFNTYGYKEGKRFVSVIDQEGYDYPTEPMANTQDNICFYRYNYDNIHPMVSAIFTKNMSIDAFVKGGDIMMNGNLKISEPLLVENKLKINLNGNTITSDAFSESNGVISTGNSDCYPLWVKNGGELTIEGNGKVIAKEATYSMAVWVQGGKLIINGGKFYNGGDGCDLIYVSNGGEAHIYGGEFHATKRSSEVPGTKNEYSALNIKDSDRATSKILVYGGRFYGFNPANNLSEGPNTNFVAEGYESVEISPNVWEVKKVE